MILPKLTTFPKKFGRSRGGPPSPPTLTPTSHPVFGKMVYSICIECSSSVDKTLLCWDIDFPLKIGNLDTTLLYVCEQVFFSVKSWLFYFFWNITSFHYLQCFEFHWYFVSFWYVLYIIVIYFIVCNRTRQTGATWILIGATWFLPESCPMGTLMFVGVVKPRGHECSPFYSGIEVFDGTIIIIGNQIWCHSSWYMNELYYARNSLPHRGQVMHNCFGNLAYKWFVRTIRVDTNLVSSSQPL